MTVEALNALDDVALDQAAREILNRHCEYMDGLSRGQRYIGAESALAAVKEALTRASPKSSADVERVALRELADDLSGTASWIDHLSLEHTQEHVNTCGRAANALSALSRSRVGDEVVEAGWRPIKSAPKDGQKLLLHNSRQSVTAVAWWSRVNQHWQSNGAGVVMHQPTHWMLLPQPPAALRKLGEDKGVGR